MKAIKCTQCGAMINEFSSEDEFAKCSYCNAKYRMRDAKIRDIPRKEVVRINTRIEKYSPDVQEIVDKDYGPSPKFILGILGVVLLVVASGIWVKGYLAGSMLFGADLYNLEYSVSAKQSLSTRSYGQKDSAPFEFDKLEFPDFFTAELHSYSKSDIPKVILAERTVKVVVKVDKNGKVIEAKALNGHTYLKKVCEKAALESSFYPPVNGNITIFYRFGIKE